ncbi:hypothetical protein N7523_004038 [Penicillium sp. IBT 18751x]|nr:hypothetical protein N7523_004038 [Penicillium sp. IBT 18751x]
MGYSSFNGRRPGQYHPRDGPRVDFLPHTTNDSGPRICGDERGSRSNSHYHQNYSYNKPQNQDQRNNYGGQQRYHDTRKFNYRSGPYQGARYSNHENYRAGNNYGRVPPSGPRSQGQTQGYNSIHRPGVNNGPREYFPKQQDRRNDFQVSNSQNHQLDTIGQDSNGRYRGGRIRNNNQSLSSQQQPPLPVTSLYCSVDDSGLFDESMEPVAPILGRDGMYYDADGDLIIEDAPNVDIAAIVTQGTIEMAKITQRLLEQIATYS